MALADIQIIRHLAVINGYVQVPPDLERDKSRVTWVDALSSFPDSSSADQLSLGSGDCTGSKFGAQRIFRLPAITVGDWYTTDPVTVLNTPGETY